MNKTIGMFSIVLLFWNEFLSAQTDSAISADSPGPAESAQGVIDQELDDSPILDFLTADKGAGNSGFEVSVRSRMSLVLERSRGFEEGLFLGSPLKSFQRLNIHSGRFRGGLVLAKDAGEVRIDDFKSGYFHMANIGVLGKLVLGDYFIEGGEGIALWRGFDFGKGGGVVRAISRTSRWIVHYRSSLNIAFLRWIGTDFHH